MLCRGGLGEPHILTLRTTLAGGRHRYLRLAGARHEKALCAGSGPIYHIARCSGMAKKGVCTTRSSRSSSGTGPASITMPSWTRWRPWCRRSSGPNRSSASAMGRLRGRPGHRSAHGGPGGAGRVRPRAGSVVAAEGLDHGAYLEFLLSHAVTQRLGHDWPCFLFDFPGLRPPSPGCGRGARRSSSASSSSSAASRSRTAAASSGMRPNSAGACSAKRPAVGRWTCRPYPWMSGSWRPWRAACRTVPVARWASTGW